MQDMYRLRIKVQKLLFRLHHHNSCVIQKINFTKAKNNLTRMPTLQTITSANKNIGKYRWTICSLIFFATTINYLDRQVISLLKPTLEKEFKWSESDYSDIVVAFQFA